MWLIILLLCQTVRAPTTDAFPANAAEANVIEPNATVQEQLARLAAAKSHTIEQSQALIDLWNLVRREHVISKHDVVRQAVLYDLDHPGKHTIVEVMNAFTIDPYILCRIMLPYHDSPDERLRKKAWLWIGGGGQNDEAPPNDPTSNAMRDFLAERSNDPPADVARAYFYRAPSTAVTQLAQRWLSSAPAKLRSIWISEHTIQDVVWKHSMQALKSGDVDNAEAELANLSKFDEWWVRLYVAHMLRRHDDIFDAPAVRARLQKDPNPLVVEAINDIFHHGMTPDEEKAAWQRLGYPNGRPSTAPLKRILDK